MTTPPVSEQVEELFRVIDNYARLRGIAVHVPHETKNQENAALDDADDHDELIRSRLTHILTRMEKAEGVVEAARDLDEKVDYACQQDTLTIGLTMAFSPLRSALSAYDQAKESARGT